MSERIFSYTRWFISWNGTTTTGSVRCLTVRDLDRDAAQPFLAAGARWGESLAQMMRAADAVITRLPTPAASASVLEAEDGLLAAMSPGKIWMETPPACRSALLIKQLRLRVEVAETDSTTIEALRDPDDGPILGALVAGGANLLVMGDRDLLALSDRYPIEPPTEFARRI